jgi:hypothetical protein
MTTKYEAFDKNDVADVLTQVTGGVESDLRGQITAVIENGLRDLLFGLVNMQSLADHGAPQVMLRVRTFQTILDDFRNELNEEYDPILRRIGRTIGFNFGITLMRILRGANRIPTEYEALLEFWAKYDSAAQMGEYRLEIKEDRDEADKAEVLVSIKDLFLTVGYDDEPLRHCPFITGYFEAALDTSLFLWTRWIKKESVYKDPKHQWTVVDADEDVSREDEGIISFTVHLSEERWTDLKDNLATAIQKCETKEWVESIRFGRIVLEHGLMILGGEDPAVTKVSFGRLLKQIDKARLPINAKRWERTYADCSKTVHTTMVLNEFNVMSMLFNIWRCVQEVERIQVSEEQIALIRSDQSYINPQPKR